MKFSFAFFLLSSPLFTCFYILLKTMNIAKWKCKRTYSPFLFLKQKWYLNFFKVLLFNEMETFDLQYMHSFQRKRHLVSTALNYLNIRNKLFLKFQYQNWNFNMQNWGKENIFSLTFSPLDCRKIYVSKIIHMMVTAGIFFLIIKPNLVKGDKGTCNWQLLCSHKKETSCNINENTYPPFKISILHSHCLQDYFRQQVFLFIHAFYDL